MTTLSLLKPLARSLALDLRKTLGSGQARIRATVLFGLALFIAYGVYYFVSQALLFLKANAHAAYIPPSTTLGFLLSVILVMIFISSFVSSVGALFFASDLSVILAAPVRRHQLYFAKLIELTLSSCWLVIIFGIPALLGYGAVYGHSWEFWAAVITAMPPYFTAPTAAAMFLAVILATILPLNRTREFMIAFGLVVIVGGVILLKLTIPSPEKLKDLTVLLSIMSRVLTPPSILNPGSWTGAVLGNVLESDIAEPRTAFLALSYSCCFLAIALGYLSFGYFHAAAYSKAQSLRLSPRKRAGIAERVILGLSLNKLLPQGQEQRLAQKELLTFVRDPSQAMQLLILAGLCVIYLYNLRMLHAIQGLDAGLRAWWQIFLMSSNALLASFVLSAMCTRLVFPSLSLEGNCWWISQVAPVSTRSILNAKSRAWTGPVCLTAAIIFAAGSIAIGASTLVCLATIAAGTLLGWGMVRLAVGLGAQYARFDWEHPSQLAASFGSLVFMLLSIAYMVIALCGPIFLAILSMRGVELTSTEWIFAGMLALLLEFAAVRIVAESSLRSGTDALERRK